MSKFLTLASSSDSTVPVGSTNLDYIQTRLDEVTQKLAVKERQLSEYKSSIQATEELMSAYKDTIQENKNTIQENKNTIQETEELISRIQRKIDLLGICTDFTNPKKRTRTPEDWAEFDRASEELHRIFEREADLKRNKQ